MAILSCQVCHTNLTTGLYRQKSDPDAGQKAELCNAILTLVWIKGTKAKVLRFLIPQKKAAEEKIDLQLSQNQMNNKWLVLPFLTPVPTQPENKTRPVFRLKQVK